MERLAPCRRCDHRRVGVGLSVCGLDGRPTSGRRECPLADPPTRPREPLPEPDLTHIAARLAVCRECDEYNGAQCERIGGCLSRWRGALERGTCPLGKWHATE